MKYRLLGSTAMRVSEIALGTVEFGMDYGFRGSSHYAMPDAGDSIRAIHCALDHGVNLIDTARAYGTAEELVGRALAETKARPFIASKASVPLDAVSANDSAAIESAVSGSVEASLTALRVDAIDLLQIHNACPLILQSPETLDILANLQREGKVRYLGVSAYGEETPLQAMQSGRFQALQVPFNLLDQSMRGSVFPMAARQNVGVLVRSAFLRGVLTPQVHALPERLAPLKEAAFRALGLVGAEVESLAEAALRFCLSFREVGSVIVGVRSAVEVESNLAFAAKGPLRQAAVDSLGQLAVEDERLLNVNNWAELI